MHVQLFSVLFCSQVKGTVWGVLDAAVSGDTSGEDTLSICMLKLLKEKAKSLD